MPEPLLAGEQVGAGRRPEAGGQGQARRVVQGEVAKERRKRGANKSQVLHEVKVISCNPTRYKPTVPG